MNGNIYFGECVIIGNFYVDFMPFFPYVLLTLVTAIMWEKKWEKNIKYIKKLIKAEKLCNLA